MISSHILLFIIVAAGVVCAALEQVVNRRGEVMVCIYSIDLIVVIFCVIGMIANAIKWWPL